MISVIRQVRQQTDLATSTNSRGSALVTISLTEARSLIVELLMVQAEHDRDGVSPPYRVITIKKPRTGRGDGNAR
jgi:hypothetical protein